MKKIFLLASFIVLGVLLGGFHFYSRPSSNSISGAPPYYGESEDEVPELDPWSIIQNWKRPDGPAKVGLQVGHWKNDEVPEELKNLRRNGGASGRGLSEWEVNYEIVTRTADILRAEGVVVDVLPTTVPPGYWADAFVAGCSDGGENRAVFGY